ncbi:MAG: alpha/beta fold hydrolase [Actinocrinis sp.]
MAADTGIAAGDGLRTETGTDRMIEVDGVRLYVRDEGSGAPLVLLHGFPFDSRIWDRVSGLLSDEFRVIRLDLRGFGRSQAPRDGYSTPRLAADVLAALDVLGVRTFTLVGHDWGGWIGYELALTAPERVRALIIVGAVHPWRLKRESLPNAWRFWHTFAFEHVMLGRLVLTRAPWFTRRLIRHWSADPARLDEELIASFARKLQEPARARAGELLHRRFVTRDIRLLAMGHYRRLRLTVPALALYGDRDPVAPASAARRPIAQADQLTSHVLADCGHIAPLEQPGAVADAIRSFSADARQGARPS